MRELSLHHVNERNTISFSPSGEDRKYSKKRNVMVLVSSEFFRKGHYHGVTLSVCKSVSIADNNIFSKMILLSYLLRHSLLALLYQHWNPPAWVRVMLMLTLQMWKWRFSSILFSYKISCFQIHIANFLTWKGINVMLCTLHSTPWEIYISVWVFQHFNIINIFLQIAWTG